MDHDDDLMEDNKANQADARKVAKGKPGKRKPKVGLNCQPGRPREVAAQAGTDFTIADCAAGGRIVAKRNLQPLMISTNGFGFIENPTSQKQIDTNVALYKSIHKDFHFGLLTNRQTHYAAKSLFAHEPLL